MYQWELKGEHKYLKQGTKAKPSALVNEKVESSGRKTVPNTRVLGISVEESSKKKTIATGKGLDLIAEIIDPYLLFPLLQNLLKKSFIINYPLS